MFLRNIAVAVCMIGFSCGISDKYQRSVADAQTRATDEEIRRSPALQELNLVCTSIPLPRGFDFAFKGGIDDQKLSLAYRYISGSPWAEARSIFRQHFSARQWAIDDMSDRYPPQIDFSDGSYRIAISMQRGGDSNHYTIYCEKL